MTFLTVVILVYQSKADIHVCILVKPLAFHYSIYTLHYTVNFSNPSPNGPKMSGEVNIRMTQYQLAKYTTGLHPPNF